MSYSNITSNSRVIGVVLSVVNRLARDSILQLRKAEGDNAE